MIFGLYPALLTLIIIDLLFPNLAMAAAVNNKDNTRLLREAKRSLYIFLVNIILLLVNPVCLQTVRSRVAVR